MRLRVVLADALLAPADGLRRFCCANAAVPLSKPCSAARPGLNVLRHPLPLLRWQPSGEHAKVAGVAAELAAAVGVAPAAATLVMDGFALLLDCPASLLRDDDEVVLDAAPAYAARAATLPPPQQLEAAPSSSESERSRCLSLSTPAKVKEGAAARGGLPKKARAAEA
jgi:hypothetical protein